ncbi:hypothetical protein BC834DRAFT_284468 [Gloeopeniophorella convolvens]|nr:hypothetical protein BC834DRAFT_284468 [Gloeopeniophorella convolvens]
MKLHLGTCQSVISTPYQAAPEPVKNDPPEALTYRFGENSAWVPTPRNHEEAIDLAKHAYPELRYVRRDRITFHTTGKTSIACITPAAWELVVRRLPHYHVVDIRIREPAEGEDDSGLPGYSYSAMDYVPQEKEEMYWGKIESGSGRSRLSRMISFVRGSDA